MQHAAVCGSGKLQTPSVMVVPFALLTNVLFSRTVPRLLAAPLEVMGQGYTASGACLMPSQHGELLAMT
jgi:hypothetical protein